MDSGKKLTFKNKANVRNLFLNPNGSANAVNYKAPTKRANGKTNVRSSLVEENYKLNPANYKWTSDYSYANTHNGPSAANKKRYLSAQGKAKTTYGNVWHNAVAIRESHNEEKQARLQQYYSKVLSLIDKLFGEQDEEVIEEFIESLEEMDKLTVEFTSGKKSKTEYMEESDIIYEDWHLNTNIDKVALMKAYPEFNKLRLDKGLANNTANAVKNRELKNLLKTKRAANSARLRRNKNTVRKWHTFPNKGENRAPGAELLALAAKHGNPANFSVAYNGMPRPKLRGIEFGTGSEVKERLNVERAEMRRQEEDEEAAANAAALEAELSKFPAPKKRAMNLRMAELNKENAGKKRPVLSMNMFKPPV